MKDYQFTWSPCMEFSKQLKKYGHNKLIKFNQNNVIQNRAKLNQIFPHVSNKTKPEKKNDEKERKKFIVTLTTSSDSIKSSTD